MNALGVATVAALGHAVSEAGASGRGSCCCVAWRAFCAGADLKERKNMDPGRLAHNAAIRAAIDAIAVRAS